MTYFDTVAPARALRNTLVMALVAVGGVIAATALISAPTARSTPAVDGAPTAAHAPAADFLRLNTVDLDALVPSGTAVGPGADVGIETRNPATTVAPFWYWNVDALEHAPLVVGERPTGPR